MRVSLPQSGRPGRLKRVGHQTLASGPKPDTHRHVPEADLPNRRQGWNPVVVFRPHSGHLIGHAALRPQGFFLACEAMIAAKAPSIDPPRATKAGDPSSLTIIQTASAINETDAPIMTPTRRRSVEADGFPDMIDPLRSVTIWHRLPTFGKASNPPSKLGLMAATGRTATMAPGPKLASTTTAVNGPSRRLDGVGSGNALITPTPKMLDLAYSLRAYLSIRNKRLQG